MTDGFSDFCREGVVECTTVCLFDCASVVFSVVGGKMGNSVNLLVVGATPNAPEKLGRMASHIFLGKES